MSEKAVNQITFDYEGKHYTLEYTPATIKRMEAAGFDISEIGSKPQTRIEQLWLGAFMAHHARVSDTVKKELWEQMKCKKILNALIEMYNTTLSNLIPDLDSDDEEFAGNVEWTATW